MPKTFPKGSRFYNAKRGKFRNKEVVYPKTINFVTPATKYVVPASQEHRPDLISLAVYGRDDLWWVIMQANNIDHISQIKANMTLVIPSVSQVL